MSRRSNLFVAAVLLLGPAVVGATKACAQEASPGLSANIGQNRPVLDQDVKNRLCALSDPTGRRCRSSQAAPSQPSSQQPHGGRGGQIRQPQAPSGSGGVRPSRRG